MATRGSTQQWAVGSLRSAVVLHYTGLRALRTHSYEKSLTLGMSESAHSRFFPK